MEAKARGNNEVDTIQLQKMVATAANINPDDALGTIRAFTQTLNLLNAAEVYHRLRLLRDDDICMVKPTPLPMREDSVAGTMAKLLETGFNQGKSPEQTKTEIYEALVNQKVEIVLTAHPTEVNRRTLLRKYREISETLSILNRKDLSPYERKQAEDALRREIFSIWGSDEIRREKPTPQIEAKGGLAIVQTVSL